MANSVTPRETYPALAIAIHWITALCVFALVPMGFFMARMDEGPAQDRIYLVHQSIGILALALTIPRIAMRALRYMPEPANILTPFERGASRMAHKALYILLIVTPLIGWLGVNAYGEKVSVFGLFDLPALAAKNEFFSDEIFVVHLACAILIVVVVMAHLLGALVHGMRRDGVNGRMRPL